MSPEDTNAAVEENVEEVEVSGESAADATDMRPQTDGAKASRSNQEVLSHDLN